MSDTDDKALALTQWGAATLDALQAASETDREAIARRACDDAIADARSMAGLQGSLFEKLLVIERFGLYRSHGCESIQEFIERAVAPVVQMHRGTLYRLKDAVWEAGRLLQRYGSVKADWSHLSLLAGETRRQEKGQGGLPADDYERVSRQVAEGSLSHRDLAVALRRRQGRPSESPAPRCRNVATTVEAHPPRRHSVSPFDELARIATEARDKGQACKTPHLVLRAIDLGDELARSLEWLSLQPADAWRFDARDLERLRQVLGAVQETATTTLAAAKAARAA